MKKAPKAWAMKAVMKIPPDPPQTEGGRLYLAERIERATGVTMYSHSCPQCDWPEDISKEPTPEQLCPAHRRIADLDESLMFEKEHTATLESMIQRIVEALGGGAEGEDPVALVERRMRESQRFSKRGGPVEGPTKKQGKSEDGCAK